MFADKLKNSTSASFRTSYIARPGYSKNYTPAPLTDNLYLSKKCGISLPFDSTISMDQYLCAVGDIVGDQNMVFAGKNNDLVKIYLKTEYEVSKLYENHPQIVIDGKVLMVRRLSENGHRIFLCNTEPGMSDSLLLNELSKFTKIVSPMQFVNLGCRNARFSHLIGFRRAVFVDNIENLPVSFNLFFENTIYKIFVVIDKVKCFRCHGEGHLVNNCPRESLASKNPSDVKNAQQSSAISIQESPILSTENDLIQNETPTSVSPQLSQISDSIINSLMPDFSQVVSENAAPCRRINNPVVKSPTEPKTVKNNHQLASPIALSEVVAEVNKQVSVTVPSSNPLPSQKSGENKNKKRSSSSSPDISEVDKKPKNTDLDVLLPIIEGYDSSLDSREFLFLIEDLRNSKKKLEVISDYSMEPKTVVSVLQKLSLEQYVDKKIKNRLKNLLKTLNTLLFPDSANLPLTNPESVEIEVIDSDISPSTDA